MEQCCNQADFHNEDFHYQDFFVNRWNKRFVRWFKDIIPHHMKAMDSYKNELDEGLWERYMMLFGEYIDEDIMPQLNCYLCIIDASICEEKFLNHISDELGNPPDIFNDIGHYRNLLSYILSVYKIKGTKEAYILFFSILGLDISINEIEPFTPEHIYDNEGIYDSPDVLATYDQGICQPCSDYEITMEFSDGIDRNIDENTINKIKMAINFNEPINAHLRRLIYQPPGAEFDVDPVTIIDEEGTIYPYTS